MMRALVIIFVLSWVSACGGTDPVTVLPASGTEGGPCYGNNTCNEPLTCAGGYCVPLDEPDAANDTSAADVTFPEDTTTDAASDTNTNSDTSSPDTNADTLPAPSDTLDDTSEPAADIMEDSSGSPDVEPEADTAPPGPKPESKGYRIGYYTNWSQYRGDPRKFMPSSIDPALYTHILYAFGDIMYDGKPGKDAKNFSIAPLEWNDIKEWTIGANPEGHMIDVINLKSVNPDLKVLVSLGGWNFNEPTWTPSQPHHQSTSTAWIFSRIIELPAERANFIKSILDFCADYGFDGVDLDWEYPGLANRNCVAGTGICEKNADGSFKDRAMDKANYGLFMAELKAAADADPRFEKFWLTMAVGAYAASAVYYDYDEIKKHVDWVGLMTYDYHGAFNANTGAFVPTGEDSEPGGTFCVKCSLQLHACPKPGKAASSGAVATLCEGYDSPDGGFGIPADQLVMGLATYGRGWAGVNEPKFNVPSTGASPPGPYTKEPGFYAYFEIVDLLTKGDAAGNSYKAYFDDATQTPFLYSPEAKIFISYDNAQGFTTKLELLAEVGLAGAMVWSMDNDLFLDSDNPKNELQQLMYNFLAK
jgi:chitinase